MSKEEVLEYIRKNCEMPKKAIVYLNDIDFVMQMLNIESTIMIELPLDIQKAVLLRDNVYIDDVFDLRPLFEDSDFAKKLVDNDNDIILKLRGVSLNNEYIKNLTIGYIKGEIVPKKGSKLARMRPNLIYMRSIKDVQEDIELANYLLNQNIHYLGMIEGNIEDPSIVDNSQYMIKYVLEYPKSFSKYYEKKPEILTPEVLKAVLKDDIHNYTLIEKDNPLIEQFYKSIERIKEIRPELSIDNPNLRYELLMDPDFVNMDVNIINSLLEYNTGNVDIIIQIKNDGNLQYLVKYIEQYNKIYGNNLENIQKAITSFEKMKDILVNTNNLGGIEIDENRLKTIIATGNKFRFKTAEDLLDYGTTVKQYYQDRINWAKSLEDKKQIFVEMLFNSSIDEFDKFYKEYCNNNFDELQRYTSEKDLDNPITEEVKKRYELLNKIKNIENEDELNSIFDNMPLTTCDIEELKNNITKMYTQAYQKEMLYLEDSNLEHTQIDGVDVIKLNGQKFNINIHRIFNFDLNMNDITNELLNNPEKWKLKEGSNTVSSTLITDKKIAAVFRGLKKKNDPGLISFETKEEKEEYERKYREKTLKIYEGDILKEIDKDAVFYGFTHFSTNGIVKMDSTDMMIEHGKGHMNANSSNCKMRSSEDLAYWTSPDYWNEIAQKRKETDIDEAKKLREKTGTDRILPTCIVCFDGNINEKSVLAAKTLKIPILMIDRQQYIDLNRQRLEEAKKEFSSSLSPDAIKEIFYRQPYYKIVQEIPNMITTIKNNGKVSADNKKLSLEYLAYLAQHFIEQSSGYIINDPVEKFNKELREYIKIIDMELEEKESSLVTMKDMEKAYKETSAINRRNRYEQLKNDIKGANSKESEKIYE